MPTTMASVKVQPATLSKPNATQSVVSASSSEGKSDAGFTVAVAVGRRTATTGTMVGGGVSASSVVCGGVAVKVGVAVATGALVGEGVAVGAGVFVFVAGTGVNVGCGARVGGARVGVGGRGVSVGGAGVTVGTDESGNAPTAVTQI
jgi:hypothetical protein